MDKVLYRVYHNFNFLTKLTNRLMKQKSEPTKYFFTSMFFRHKVLVKYNAYEVKQWWFDTVREIRNGERQKLLNFFINIPFCKSKCSYCMHPSILFSKKILNNYLKRIFDEMKFYQDVFHGIKFRNIYIGGGSPSILNEKQIEITLSNLFKNFSFFNKGQRTFECNPSSTNFKKLKIIKRFGFNRVSFGVQSLDRKVLKYANREYQWYESVKRTILDAQKCGFKIINVDLMIGLYGDNPESLLKSFKKISELNPTTISLYHLHPPTDYLKKYFNNDEKLFYSMLKKKTNKVLKLIKHLANKYDYVFPNSIYLHEGYSLNFSKRSYIKEKIKNLNFSYYSSLPYSVFGIGNNSVSKIVGKVRYQNILTLDYSFNPKDTCYWGAFCQLKDDMRDYILNKIVKEGIISKSDFKKVFNKDLINSFYNTFFTLEKLGKIKITKDLIYFLSKDSRDIFICGLFFWDKDELLKILFSERNYDNTYWLYSKN